MLRRMLAAEGGGWRSLYRWLARRPRVGPGETAHPYEQPNRLLLWVFIVVSAIEVAVVDLIVHRWPVPRAIALVVGVWGLLFMLGLLAGIKTHPHAVGPRGLTVRSGGVLAVHLPWTSVAGVRSVRRSLESARGVQLAGETLSLPVLSQVSVVATLTEPVEVALPDGTTGPVTVVELWADDPRALVEDARAHLVPA